MNTPEINNARSSTPKIIEIRLTNETSEISAPGYAHASVVSDYTHILHLPRSERVAVFNLITGRYWVGDSSNFQEAIHAVEEHAGSELAVSRLERMEVCYAESRNKARPTSLVVLPTYGCNLSCGYCYEGKLTKNQGYWSVESALKAADACIEFLNERGIIRGLTSLTVLGGEPVRSENIDALCALVKKISDQKISHTRIITNAVELSAHAQRLVECGVDSFMVTIDGPKNIHDKRRPSRFYRSSSFEKSMSGIDCALKAGASVTIRVNVDADNIHSVGALAMEFMEKGLFEQDNFAAYIYPVSTDFRTSRKYATEAELSGMLAEEVEKFPILKAFVWEFHGLDAIYSIRSKEPLSPKLRYCGATQDQFVIDYNKNIYPCWFGTGKDGFKIGTYDSEKNFLNIDSDANSKWRSRGPFSIEPCKSCKWALVCGSGCSFKAHLKTGSFLNPNCAPFDDIFSSLGPLILEDCV